jgi:glycerate kinase
LKNKQLIKSLEFLSGAGGGIPVSFQIFLNSYCKSSYEFILNDLKLADQFSKFDYLITGEGAFDRQTLFGKGAGLLMMYYANKVKRIFLVCGKIDSGIKEYLPQNVVPIELLSYYEDKDQSIKNYEFGIKKACQEICKQIQF